MAQLTCPSGHSNPEGVALCLTCFGDLTAAEPPPPTRQVPVTAPAACPECGGPLPAGGGRCLSCRVEPAPAGGEHPGNARGTRRESSGPSLEIDGTTMPVGGSVLLGRGDDSPTAQILGSRDNVSRRHATVRTDADGTLWVCDEHSANGTFVAGRRIPEGRDHPLRRGDELRLASDVVITVHWDGLP